MISQLETPKPVLSRQTSCHFTGHFKSSNDGLKIGNLTYIPSLFLDLSRDIPDPTLARAWPTPTPPASTVRVTKWWMMVSKPSICRASPTRAPKEQTFGGCNLDTIMKAKCDTCDSSSGMLLSVSPGILLGLKINQGSYRLGRRLSYMHPLNV